MGRGGEGEGYLVSTNVKNWWSWIWLHIAFLTSFLVLSSVVCRLIPAPLLILCFSVIESLFQIPPDKRGMVVSGDSATVFSFLSPLASRH